MESGQAWQARAAQLATACALCAWLLVPCQLPNALLLRSTITVTHKVEPLASPAAGGIRMQNV